MFLELQNIRKSFGEGENRVEVLKGINLSVEEGEVCVLLGPSGSGKSTLLNIIGGIDTADYGDIIVRGEQMRQMKEKALEEVIFRILFVVSKHYIALKKPIPTIPVFRKT